MNATAQRTDAELRLHVPEGHKWNYIFIALTKRTLQIPGIKTADRLDLLEKLNALGSGDTLTIIEPMCDTAYAIFKEARTLDPPKDETHCEASFNVLASEKVFGHFCALNPSIMVVIRDRTVAPAAPPPAETSPPLQPSAMSASQFAHTQRRMNGHNGVTPHRSHYPPNQINRVGGDLPAWTFDNGEKEK